MLNCSKVTGDSSIIMNIKAILEENHEPFISPPNLMYPLPVFALGREKTIDLSLNRQYKVFSYIKVNRLHYI